MVCLKLKLIATEFVSAKDATELTWIIALVPEFHNFPPIMTASGMTVDGSRYGWMRWRVRYYQQE